MVVPGRNALQYLIGWGTTVAPYQTFGSIYRYKGQLYRGCDFIA